MRLGKWRPPVLQARGHDESTIGHPHPMDTCEVVAAVPKSRSKRSSYKPPKPPKPKPSPRWLAPLGLALIGVGVLLVLLAYMIPGFPGGNINLIVGFALMAAGLAVLSQYR